MRHVLLMVSIVALAACSAGEAPAEPGDPSGGDPPGSPPPAGPLPAIGGCQIFPADNAWNRDVSADPGHPNSSALIAQMVPDDALHLDLGTREEYYGIPYTVVPTTQPLVPIRFGTDGVDYSDESDPGPMPIPLDAPIEAAAAPNPIRRPATGTCWWCARATAPSTSCTTRSATVTASG